MAQLPTVVTSAGLTPILPADARAQIVADVTSTNPGFTDNLPLSMVEDVVSTDTAAVLLMDGGRVASLNDLTTAGINEFLLAQQGQMFGIPLGLGSNVSVFQQFVGTPGFVINPGFLVSDGSYQYTLIDGGIVGTDRGDGNGVSALLFALATITGDWAVPPGTVTTLNTSLPPGVVLTTTNPQAGIPSSDPETAEDYRVRVYDGQLAVSGGTTQLLKTLVGNVSGVQPNLISMIQLPDNEGWEIIVGGGDPFLVGYAIQQSGVDLASLVGSTINVTNVTNANPGVATTDKNHGLTNGQTGVNISGATPSGFNVTGATVTVIDEKNFSYAVNTSGFGAYAGGGVLTPNPRNISVSLNDFPNAYTVPYVSPPQQTVTVAFTWNTSLPDFVQASAVAQAASPAIAAYINAITVGQPINEFEMQAVFQTSVASILDPTLITRMVISVTINGVVTAPTSGTGIIVGDPESYFLTSSSSVTVTQG